MEDSQKKGKGMSGGQKIDDHSFWAGSKTSTNPFPNGVKSKQYMSADEAGTLKNYEDTTEKIKSAQDKNASQAKAYPTKPAYRN
jgi:hypothetical protein